jgi:hypothetical protein
VRGRSTAAIPARLRQSAHPRVEGPEFFSNPHIPVHHESVLASTLHRKRMTRPTSRVFKPLRKIGAGRCFPVCVCVDAPAPRCALRPQPTCIIARAPAFEAAKAAARAIASFATTITIAPPLLFAHCRYRCTRQRATRGQIQRQQLFGNPGARLA